MAVNDLVMAANSGVPGNDLKPHNCHEAALGWVLMANYPMLRSIVPTSQGVPKVWVLIRSLAERYGSANPKQLTGQWMSQNIYNQRFLPAKPLPRPPGQQGGPNFTMSSFLVGDVLFMGNRVAPHHSMVVVEKIGTSAMVRGFNNAGALGGPFMEWDPELRVITAPERWDAQGKFKANNGPCDLYRITYDNICQNIPNDLTPRSTPVILGK